MNCRLYTHRQCSSVTYPNQSLRLNLKIIFLFETKLGWPTLLCSRLSQSHKSTGNGSPFTRQVPPGSTARSSPQARLALWRSQLAVRGHLKVTEGPEFGPNSARSFESRRLELAKLASGPGPGPESHTSRAAEQPECRAATWPVRGSFYSDSGSQCSKAGRKPATGTRRPGKEGGLRAGSP